MYEVSPLSTNVGELAPPELKIPIFFVIDPTHIEYSEEYIAVERTGSGVQGAVLRSLGNWW